MAVESWIDEITKLAGEVSDGRGGYVHSYRVFERDEYPESLSVFPCALTYTTEVMAEYSDGGPHNDLWHGQTEFHLFDNVAKSNYPALMRYFNRIKAAFALHRTLGGKVSYCLLRPDEPNIQGPVILQYGSEEPHLGIIARWVVKEQSIVTLGL